MSQGHAQGATQQGVWAGTQVQLEGGPLRLTSGPRGWPVLGELHTQEMETIFPTGRVGTWLRWDVWEGEETGSVSHEFLFLLRGLTPESLP